MIGVYKIVKVSAQAIERHCCAETLNLCPKPCVVFVGFWLSKYLNKPFPNLMVGK